MSQIKHVNLCDESGKVYCCLRNKVVTLDDQQRSGFCSGCKMFAGFAGGLGVECIWEDLRPVSDPHVSRHPYAEMLSNQRKQVLPTDHLATFTVFSG